MATCSICKADVRRRRAVDESLLSGMPKAQAARKHGFSRYCLIRHERHLQRAVAAGAQDAGELDYGRDLLEQIHSINSDLDRLQAASEAGGDRRGAVAAIREKLRSLELTAKLSGQIATGSRSLTLVSNSNTVIDEATALKMARIFLERHQGSSIEDECTPKS